MKEETFPARLHVLSARDNAKALVIRRGPSKSVGVFAWDRKNNTFEISQSLKGRIYERRSDISPCGKYWVYFAINGKWNSEVQGAWTAVARTPWLKAVSLYAKGDCWHGGGLFLDEKTYWLNDGHGHEKLVTSSKVERNESYNPPNEYGGECPHVYYNRLQRDGWSLKSRAEKAELNSETVFEKELAKKWILRKVCHEQVGSPKGKGGYWDEHEIQSEGGGSLFMPKWEWAEWLDDTIVYAEEGRLYKVVIKSLQDLSAPKLLHDFNEYRFEERLAPY